MPARAHEADDTRAPLPDLPSLPSACKSYFALGKSFAKCCTRQRTLSEKSVGKEEHLAKCKSKKIQKRNKKINLLGEACTASY
jgi:hypothetical protein